MESKVQVNKTEIEENHKSLSPDSKSDSISSCSSDCSYKSLDNDINKMNLEDDKKDNCELLHNSIKLENKDIAFDQTIPNENITSNSTSTNSEILDQMMADSNVEDDDKYFIDEELLKDKELNMSEEEKSVS